MIFLARPLSTYICLLPWRKSLPFNARLFVSWVGLRGASPIIFAILCVAASVPRGEIIFNIVFFCTLISLLVQGTSLSAMARLLKVDLPPLKKHNIKINGEVDLMEEVKSVSVEILIIDEMLRAGNQLMDLGLPHETLAILVRRPRVNTAGEVLFVPTGRTELQVGDHLLVIGNDKTVLNNLKETLIEHADVHKLPARSLLENIPQWPVKYLRMIKEKLLSLKRKKEQ